MEDELRTDTPQAGGSVGDAGVGVPLGEAPQLPRRRGSELTVGLQLDPVKKLAAFSPDVLEAVVEHWVREKVRGRYAEVVRFAGAGDKGRDVAAYEHGLQHGDWDNYQCKRYERKLAPATVWAELGKLVYWVTQGAFRTPKSYTFVAPLGCGAQTRDLLADHNRVREGLAKNWDSQCKKLCSYDDICDALATFEFPALTVAQGGDIVDDLQGTALFPILFGGGLAKPRPAIEEPPTDIQSREVPYVGALLDAYDDHCERPIDDASEAFTHDVYGPHLRGSRREFYCAESLREFSKDVLIQPDTFEGLQEQIEDGVRHTAAQTFPSGYDRVLAVCKHSVVVQVDDHPLARDLRPADRAGMCHQLANDGRLVWVRHG